MLRVFESATSKESNKKVEIDLKRCIDKTVFKPKRFNLLEEEADQQDLEEEAEHNYNQECFK